MEKHAPPDRLLCSLPRALLPSLEGECHTSRRRVCARAHKHASRGERSGTLPTPKRLKNTTFLSTLAFAKTRRLTHYGTQVQRRHQLKPHAIIKEHRIFLTEAETRPKSQCLLHAALKLGHASPHWQ